MDKKTFDLESKKLTDTVSKVLDAKTILEDRLKSIGEDNLAKLKDLRENPETSGADFHFFLDQIHNENLAFNVKDKYVKLEELSFLIKEPYFARIDLQEKDTQEIRNVYIGKFGYTEDLPVVTDWRAKIASVYYRFRYPQKNVKYETPDGVKVEDLLLKRTFEIDNGSLVKFYNNDIQFDESEIIADKIEKRTGGVLEDIVETIQESQLDIIEADPRQICIVQGCVGSGKSTVAIHKLSHIFFNFPEIIKPERSILIAKNQILVGYLSTLFPKLGIFDINYRTLRELVVHMLFREELEIKVDLEKNQDTSVFGMEKINKLNIFIDKEHTRYKDKIDKLFENEEYESFGGFKYSKLNTPYENISDSIDDLEEELSMQLEAYNDNPKSIRALFYKENMRTLKKIVTNLKTMRIELQNNVFPKLLKAYNILPNDKLGYLESLIYIYLYLELIGLKKYKKYEYCVVDEGQDFSILEYAVMGKLVMHGRFCILGDLNQGFTDEGIEAWEDISNVIKEAKSAQTFTLDTNYRSTKPIINLANNILSSYTKNYLPKSINRKGSDPIIVEFSSKEELLKEFKSNIQKDVQTLNKSVGIVSFTDSMYQESKSIIETLNLEGEKYIELEKDKKITYLPKGIYVTMFENCKGLEFSKVYILDMSLTNIKNFKEAKKSFVAVTRAMNEVCVYSLK